jgi:hypothetical protein
MRWFALLAFAGCPAFGSLLDQFQAEDEAKAALVLDKASFKPQLLAEAMARGWWGMADDIIEFSQLNGIDIDAQYDYQARLIQQKLDSLRKKVKRQSRDLPIISPALQWTQSANDLHLLVKFSHKMDAPATMGVKDDNVLMEESSFGFNASNADKKFHLALDLFSDIVPDESTYTCGEAHGRCTFVLRKKSNASKWPRLLQDSTKKLRNMHIWWAMQEQIEEAEEKNDAEKRDLRESERKEERKKGQAKDAKDDEEVDESQDKNPEKKETNKDKKGKKKGVAKKKKKKSSKNQGKGGSWGQGLGTLDENGFVATLLRSVANSPLAMVTLAGALLMQLVGLYFTLMPLLAPLVPRPQGRTLRTAAATAAAAAAGGDVAGGASTFITSAPLLCSFIVSAPLLCRPLFCALHIVLTFFSNAPSNMYCSPPSSSQQGQGCIVLLHSASTSAVLAITASTT